jgi:hypothetical protein
MDIVHRATIIIKDGKGKSSALSFFVVGPVGSAVTTGETRKVFRSSRAIRA